MSTLQQTPVSERLKNGAKIMGGLWKDPAQRCPAGWSIEICTCAPLKKFCQGRLKWLTLAVEDGRDLEEGPYGLALAMTASEWDATGLTMKIEHAGIGMILVGSGQDSVTGMVDMGRMIDAPEVLASTLRVLKAFPKSKVVGLEAMPVVPATVELAVELAVELPAEIEANPDEAFE